MKRVLILNDLTTQIWIVFGYDFIYYSKRYFIETCFFVQIYLDKIIKKKKKLIINNPITISLIFLEYINILS